MSGSLLSNPLVQDADAGTQVLVEGLGLPAADGEMLPGASPDVSVASRVIGGTSALGLGMVIERGAGFVANVLAARVGGTATFGAYSLAISTANQISTYAAGGIGATAARFSGKYPRGSANYQVLARALAIVSIVSAILAAAALWFGAGPIAHLLGKAQLASLLHWAVLSSAGIILLECARGFFVGQRLLSALVLLSIIVGAGMLLLIPAAAALHSPTRMLVLQSAVTGSAVLLCLLFSRRLGIVAPPTTSVGATSLPTMLREVWTFGFVQLAGLAASSMAGWWLTTLVVRTDTSLVQMSFFAIASQLRNIVGIAPGLLTEGSYAVMADPSGETSRTPHRVMALCTYASLGVALILASVGMVLAPWALNLVYGRSYSAATLTVVLGLAVAVVHMGNAPAAARLTIVSIKAAGIINTVWAVFVAALATMFLFFGGSAWQAMLIYLLAHLLSAGLVLLALRRYDFVPAGLIPLAALSTASVSLTVVLAYLRVKTPAAIAPLTTAMVLLLVASVALLALMGKRHGWLPAKSVLHAAVLRLVACLPGRRTEEASHV